MAPTEILAEQHFRKLVGWLRPLGTDRGLAHRQPQGQGEAMPWWPRWPAARRQLVVGTHAVIQDDVAFAKLGLAVVDEQHRFGVAQRLAPARKLPGPRRQLEPHLLMMSATPIPRTLAMSYFADLDVSTIDELPPGRTPIVTKVFADGKRDAVIARIADEVAQGRQVYWVCPLVEESEHIDLQNATATHAELMRRAARHAGGPAARPHEAAEKAAVMRCSPAAR